MSMSGQSASLFCYVTHNEWCVTCEKMTREFTDEEKQKLVEFRTRLQEILKNDKDKDDDYYLIRWLRARNLDLDKAEEMLRTSLKWRMEIGADKILETEHIPEKYLKMYPTAYWGGDKEDNPVICLPLGRFHHKIALEEVGMEKFLKWNTVWAETLMKKLKEKEIETGKKGLQLIEIIDMEHYSFREITYKPSRDFIVNTQKIFEQNYPEMLKSMLIINAPKIFAMAFNLIKPLLPQETLDKMNIFGCDEDLWKAVIKEKFSLEKIPIRWGGTLKGSDIFCSQDPNVWEDAPLPLSYFTEDDVEEDGFTKTKVGARDKLKIDVPVTSPGSELRWRFRTEGHDIGFMVTCPDGQTPVPWSRLDSHSYTQQGSINCEKSGNYRLTFDNSFSYTKSKVLKYHMEVIDPENIEQFDEVEDFENSFNS